MARKREYAKALSVLDDKPLNFNDTGDVQDKPKQETKDVKVDEKPVQEVKQEDVKVKPKEETETEPVNNNSNNETETEDVNIKGKHNNKTSSLDDLGKAIHSMFEEKSKKKTMEETHTRTTFLIQNKILEDFNKLTKGKRGYKTILINQLLGAYIESQKKK